MAKYPPRKFTLTIIRTNIGNLDTGFKVLKNDEIGLPEIYGRRMDELLKKLTIEMDKIGY